MTPHLKRTLLRASDLLPAMFRRQLFRAAGAFGREEAFPSTYASLHYLRAWGFSPHYAVDVGAYHGEWTTLMKSLFSDVEVLMVEPQQSKRTRLELVRDHFTPDVVLETQLLGATDGEVVPFVEMESGSSVFEEISDHYPRATVHKQTTSLDTLLAHSLGWGRVDFLKLDVQGYELEVLKGASAFLPRTEFVLMETSIVPQNAGCPTIEEVFAFMAARGFRMLDFCGQWRRPNKALTQIDLLFLNARSTYAPRVFHDHTRWLKNHSIPASETLPPETWRLTEET